MPKMRNISERTFIIAGKELKKGQSDDFAQSVIDRHVAMYPRELEAVTTIEENAPHTHPYHEHDFGHGHVIENKYPINDGASTLKEEIKEETPPVVAENETTETVADNATVEEVAEDAPPPKRRGRKPKAKE